MVELNVCLPIKIYADNKGTILLADNTIVKLTKHIDTCYHVIIQNIENVIITIEYFTSKENLSDIFKKNNPIYVYESHSDKIIIKN